MQGVFFRRFVSEHGSALGLAGWVRNLADGVSVEIWAEGPRSRLEAFLKVAGRGPRGARVERVEAAWVSPRGEPPGFRVR